MYVEDPTASSRPTGRPPSWRIALAARHVLDLFHRREDNGAGDRLSKDSWLGERAALEHQQKEFGEQRSVDKIADSRTIFGGFCFH
jgi:hypothetical protein